MNKLIFKHNPREVTPLFLNLFSKLLLLSIILSLFIPFSPKMPAPGLDPSWALGLNQAIAQGLAFGKQIIFTLGPYSFIYTKAYHPATDLLMICGSFYLAVFYWLGLIFLMQGIRWYGVLAFCVVFLGMIYSRDSLLFSYPLLSSLVGFKLISKEYSWPINKYFFMALIAAPLGLLSLIKGSVLILCFSTLLLCFIFLILMNQNIVALIWLVAPLGTLLFFWLLAGQALRYLPDYLINSFYIASGFTEAMSFQGNNNEVILYVLGSLFILCTLLKQKYLSRSALLFLLGLFFIFLFVSFKTGFTRHFGHALIPGTSILFASLFLLLAFQTKLSYLLLLCSLSFWYYINSHYTQISIRDNFLSTYSPAWYGLKRRINEPSWLEKNFSLTLAYLNNQVHFPVLKGTTDIYSYDQSYLISSQNTWAPRPIFQSYSVFTSRLAEENKAYLQGKNKPDFIIFTIQPIDGRFSSLEDGASWPLLLAYYEPIQVYKDYLFLHKKEKLSKKKKLLLLGSEQHTLNELIPIPAHKEPLFIRLDIKPTLWGRLALIFFKPNQLQIICHLKNGTQKTYRLSANMAQSDFLLSPLIENTSEFLALFQEKELSEEQKVASFSIRSEESRFNHWENGYTIYYTQ
jgi:hypothetical protein